MNKLLLIILLLLNFSAFSQKKLNGIFSGNFDTYKFSKSGTFEVSSGDDTYTIKGKGKYILKEDKLKLTFTEYEPLKKAFEIEHRNCESGEYSGPIFFIKDKETKRGISGAALYLTIKKNSLKYIGGGEADIEGEFRQTGNLLESYKDSLITVDSYYKDYERVTFDFKYNPCQNIVIELEKENPHNRRRPDGLVWEFTIKKFTDKEKGFEGIILVGDKGSFAEGYKVVLYKRKESK